MRDVLLGALAGILVGGGIAAIGALRAKVRYEALGADLTADLTAAGKAAQTSLQASGDRFRILAQNIVSNYAQVVAANRVAADLRGYGLGLDTLARLETWTGATS